MMNRVISVVLLSLVVSLGVGTGAYAAEVTKTDAVGDAPDRLDITRTTYRNGPERISVSIRVPDLQRRGAARLVIALPRTDVAYVASVRVHDNNSLKKKFAYTTSVSQTPVQCHVRASWNAQKGRIAISVRHRCVRKFSSERLYMSATTGSIADWARPVRRLERG